MSTVYINTDPLSFGPGTWNSLTMQALFSRTEARIQSFIELAVLQMVSLLCSDCSEHAFDFIQKRHPNSYRHRTDARGERLGMWYWIVDIHNDVNHRIREKYPERNVHIFTLEEAEAIYAPVLALTTEQVEAALRAAASSQTMVDIPLIRFDNIDADDEVPVTDDKKVVSPFPSTPAVNTSDAKTPTATVPVATTPVPAPTLAAAKTNSAPNVSQRVLSTLHNRGFNRYNAIQRVAAQPKQTAVKNSGKCSACGH